MNDPDNVPVWNSNVIEYERITEGPLKQGTQNRVKSKVVGKTLDVTNEVTEFEEGRRDSTISESTVHRAIRLQRQYECPRQVLNPMGADSLATSYPST